MEGLTKLKEQLEYLFIRVIISGLKTDTLPIPEAKKLAQNFLTMEPFASVDDAHLKVNTFVEANPKFSLLKEYADVFYDEERMEEKLEIMKKHLKDNNIDEAISIIKP